MRRFALTILMAAQCISGQLAHADSASNARLQSSVRFADLDLARIDGAAALYGRLHAAARDVCRPLDERRLERAVAFNACVADALSTAVVTLDQPLLTLYYRAKFGPRSGADPKIATR
jgi:UrcA family protein